MSGYIQNVTAEKRDNLPSPSFLTGDEEKVMERNEEHSAAELIDLGTVLTETKGSAAGMGDTVIQRQLVGIGLEDD